MVHLVAGPLSRVAVICAYLHVFAPFLRGKMIVYFLWEAGGGFAVFAKNFR